MASIDIRNVSRCQVAEKSIIFLLTYHVSEKKHPLVNANNELRKLQTNFSTYRTMWR